MDPGYPRYVRRTLLFLAALAGMLPLAVAAAALVGLGLLRTAHPGIVASATALLLGLPMVGVAAMAGRGPGATVVALWVWPPLLLIGLPSYFPGQVPDAITTGFAVFGAPAGVNGSATLGLFGKTVATAVETLPQGRPPPPLAEPPEPECPPPSVVTNGDQVALPYEGQGHSLTIPVQFGDTELPMLFDTGASLTTLSRKALRSLGVAIPSDAPEVTLRTANGPRTARLVLIPQVWIGGFGVPGVTVGVCDECADGTTRGLLGLNVSGQFLVTLDTARKEVVLQQRPGGADRLVDIGPWIDVEAKAAIYPDERVEVTVTGTNRAARTITTATVGVTCGEETFVVTLTDIAGGATRSESASLPRGTVCDAYHVTLDGALW